LYNSLFNIKNPLDHGILDRESSKIFEQHHKKKYRKKLTLKKSIKYPIIAIDL